MNRLIITALVILYASACSVKEEVSSTSVILFNNTEHQISITSFRNGVANNSSLIHLPNYGNYTIESGSSLGKTKGPVYFFDYFQNVDSVVVMWDNTYPITHMISDSFISTDKYIPFGNSRNLGNGNAYTNELTEETKYTIAWTVKYTFTEQDYLDAKE